MARFEELQQLWQRQPERSFTRRDAAELTHAFRRYGRRNDFVGVAKILVIAIQLCFLVSVFRHRPLTLFGACVVDFSALYFMLFDWRKQRAIARMDFAAPSVATEGVSEFSGVAPREAAFGLVLPELLEFFKPGHGIPRSCVVRLPA